MKLISIYSRKGGVSKTSLSFALSKELENTYYMTNDEDGGEIVIETLGKDKASLITNKIPNVDFLVYDGGGYVDDMTLNFLKNSDVILIPTLLENRSLRSARKLINELRNHELKTNKIALVVNRFKSTKEKEDKKAISEAFEDVEILYIRESKVYENLINNNMSMKEYLNSMPIYRRMLKTIYPEFLKLVEYVR
jgi:cellulose biosynthesis protein BcsQ